MEKIVFALGLLLVFVELSYGGTPKVVTGTVITSQGETPTDEDLSFEAYIKNRPQDKLYQDSAGCGYNTGNWWVAVANFEADWQVGEILCIEFSDAKSGESSALEIELDGSTTQILIDDFSLPVQLSFFTAKITLKGVILRWRTESEINNIGFAIYRNNKKIAFVSGAGNSAMPIEYKFTDKKIGNYYLESIDISGKKEKSKVLKIRQIKTTWGKIKKL